MFLVPMVHEAEHAAIAGFYRWPIFEFRVLPPFPCKNKAMGGSYASQGSPFCRINGALKTGEQE